MSRYDPFAALLELDDEDKSGAMVEDATEELDINDQITAIEGDITALRKEITNIDGDIGRSMTLGPEERRHVLGAIRVRKREILINYKLKNWSWLN